MIENRDQAERLIRDLAALKVAARDLLRLIPTQRTKNRFPDIRYREARHLLARLAWVDDEKAVQLDTDRAIWLLWDGHTIATTTDEHQALEAIDGGWPAYKAVPETWAYPFVAGPFAVFDEPAQEEAR